MSKNINLDLALTTGAGVGLGLLMLAMIACLATWPEVSHGTSRASRLQVGAHLACAKFVAQHRVGTTTTFAGVRNRIDVYAVPVHMDWEEWTVPHPEFCSKGQTAGECGVGVRRRKLVSCTYGE